MCTDSCYSHSQAHCRTNVATDTGAHWTLLAVACSHIVLPPQASVVSVTVTWYRMNGITTASETALFEIWPHQSTAQCSMHQYHPVTKAVNARTNVHNSLMLRYLNRFKHSSSLTQTRVCVRQQAGPCVGPGKKRFTAHYQPLLTTTELTWGLAQHATLHQVHVCCALHAYARCKHMPRYCVELSTTLSARMLDGKTHHIWA